ncbi:MAG: helix-turn-helix domain-containing protein [Pseudobdellovibrionaceae bacterium]
MQEIYRDLAWKLIKLRQQRDLTQEQLSLKVGLSRCQISRVERGQGQITLENLHILANYFEMTLEELFRKTPKVDIEIKLRTESLEKYRRNSHTFVVKTYMKALGNKAKIQSIEIPPKSLRKMKIETNLCYEIYALQGAVTVRTIEDSIAISNCQLLSAKGTGQLHLVNMSLEKATLLIVAY